MQPHRIAPALLALVLSPLACGGEPTLPAGEPVGKPFPAAEGQSLAGETVRIPADFAGEPVLLLLGYVQDAQFDADRWLFGLLDAGLGLRFFEVPTIKGFVPGLLRRSIDSGMRGGIPQEDWGSVVTLYGERAAEVVRFTGNERPQNVRAVLLDGDGVVRWFHDRGYSAGKLIELRAALAELRQVPAADPPPAGEPAPSG